MMKLIAILVLLVVLLPIAVLAQDDEPTYTVSVWLATEVDEDGNPVEADPTIETLGDGLPLYVGFIQDEATGLLLGVWNGPDIVYTPTGPGTYLANLLVVSSIYEYSGTLDVIDADTMMSTSTVTYAFGESESIYLYERVEDESFALYTEQNRDVIEWTQFQECLGREGGDPPGTFTTPDLLVMLSVGETELVWNQSVYAGDGTTFSRNSTLPFGELDEVIDETFSANGDALDYSYYSIAGGRDDCELRYSSEFVPFAGDLLALFAAADELASAE